VELLSDKLQPVEQIRNTTDHSPSEPNNDRSATPPISCPRTRKSLDEPLQLTPNQVTMTTTKSFALPKDPLTPLDPNAEPTLATIRRLKQELYNNAQSVSSLLEGGLHGHLGLLMEEAAYTAISHGNTAYVFPDRPEAPNYTGKTQVERDVLKDAYGIDLDIYIEARDLSNVLKALIIKAVPDLFIATLKDQTSDTPT
jgi:hypothetical protein